VYIIHNSLMISSCIYTTASYFPGSDILQYENGMHYCLEYVTVIQILLPQIKHKSR
jgi:hypothetical protein